MAHPMGFYAKHGLNVEVIKTAGWAVIRDKTINKEYDAAHMLSPMPIAITLGAGSNADSLHDAGDREHQRPGHHACDQAQGQARSERLEGLQVRGAVRLLDAQLSAAVLCGRARASIPTPTSRSAPCRRRKWWPTCAPTTSTASSAPDPMNQRAVYDGVGFIHLLSKDIWEGHPCCAFAASKEFVTGIAEHLRGAAQGNHRRHRLRGQGGKPQADRRGDRAGELSQPAGHGAGADPDRHLCRRARQREDGAEPHRLRSVPVGIVRGLDHDADEALGSDQGRRRLRRRRQAGVPRHRHDQTDEGGRADAAGHDHEDLRGHG